MNFAKEARSLVNYIESLDSFVIIDVSNRPIYSHIGGLFTDIVLQSGLNYNKVVRPRVLRIINEYPNANTVSSFDNIIKERGLSKIINWNHPVKLQRINDIISFSKLNSIDTCIDLKEYLSIKSQQGYFLNLNGVGPKTLDYTLKLLSYDTVAVDRHIKWFLRKSGLNISDYQSVKKIVEFAADYMNVSRATIDFSIWKYMSDSNLKKGQLRLDI